LTTVGLKQMLLTFERKINVNQRQRMKWPDTPAKFIDSELDLDQELKQLQVVATAPNLYPVFVRLCPVPDSRGVSNGDLPGHVLQVKLGAVRSLFRLLSHENTDICIAVIKLLDELTEPDAMEEDPDAAMTLVDEIVAQAGLSLLVDNLSRLKESSEDDARGVYHTLSIFENLSEVKVRS